MCVLYWRVLFLGLPTCVQVVDETAYRDIRIRLYTNPHATMTDKSTIISRSVLVIKGSLGGDSMPADEKGSTRLLFTNAQSLRTNQDQKCSLTD